jgi:hypothetical protein
MMQEHDASVYKKMMQGEGEGEGEDESSKLQRVSTLLKDLIR